MMKMVGFFRNNFDCREDVEVACSSLLRVGLLLKVQGWAVYSKGRRSNTGRMKFKGNLAPERARYGSER